MTCNPTRTLPNQIFHLKRFLMDSFTLGPTPKIDFIRTLEHTGNGLRASRSSILPKHPLKALWNSPPNSVQNTDLEPPIYRLQETSKTAEIQTLFVERSDGNLPRPDGFLWYPSETVQFNPYQVCVRTAWHSVQTVFAKILFAFEWKSGVYLNYWISSGRVVESSGRSANTEHRPNVLPSHPDGLQRLPKQCRFLKIDSLLNTD